MAKTVSPQEMLSRMKSKGIQDAEIERETGIHRTTIWRIRNDESSKSHRTTAMVIRKFWISRGRP